MPALRSYSSLDSSLVPSPSIMRRDSLVPRPHPSAREKGLVKNDNIPGPEARIWNAVSFNFYYKKIDFVIDLEIDSEIDFQIDYEIDSINATSGSSGQLPVTHIGGNKNVYGNI